MGATIRAIVINPEHRTVSQIDLPITPGNPEQFYGPQPAKGVLNETIGCRIFTMFQLDKANQCVISDDSMLRHDTGEPAGPLPEYFWQWGGFEGGFERCTPIPGIGIITGWTFATDTWSDTTYSLDEIRKNVHFTKRDVQGYEVTQNDDGFRVETIAPIARPDLKVLPGLPGNPIKV
jgi:hypothetical protein